MFQPLETSQLLTRAITVPAPLEEVFAFFSDAGNLQQLTPPQLNFQILTPLPIPMHKGQRIKYKIGLYGIPMYWHTEITLWEPPHAFIDEQLSGPYEQWIHLHTFRSDANGHTVIEDRVRYNLYFGVLGMVALPWVKKQLNEIFDYRHQVIERLFAKDAEPSIDV